MDVRITDRSRARWARWIAALAALLCGLTLLAWWLLSAIGRDDAARQLKVQHGAVDLRVIAQARAVPRNERLIAAPVTATVSEIAVGDGAPVKAGQLLFRLTSIEADRQFATARQELAALENQLEQDRVEQSAVVDGRRTDLLKAQKQQDVTRAQFEAERTLAAEGIVSAIALERTRGELEIARAEHEQAQRSLDTTQRLHQARLRNLSQRIASAALNVSAQEQRIASLEVRAPDDGSLVDLAVKLGQEVSQGAELAQMIGGELDVLIELFSQDAPYVRVGDPVVLRSGLGEFPASVVSVPVQATDGVFRLRAVVDGDRPAWLRSGQTLEANIVIARLAAATFVETPAAARPFSIAKVQRRRAGSNEFDEVSVRFGPVTAELAVIEEGLVAGDVILAYPQRTGQGR